ncbi:MAG TPA: prolipoprotein diacylglyceryl transferase family protein, partial [Candidatus Limnocylindrales bacterium]
MAPALIEVGLDPLLHLGGLEIRWQTIGLTVALLVALALAARIASYLPPRLSVAELAAAPVYPAAPAVGARHGSDLPTSQRLRLDDLAYIVLGVVPGAVVGGRIVHGIVYWDAYAADPARLLDGGVGSLSLLGAVLGGALTGGYVASLLAAPVRRWADALSIPLLLAIGLGKLAQLLGGSGQGAAFDGSWAVAFTGSGPWHSLNPAQPAHPAQVYEALWALVGIIVLLRVVGAAPDLARALPAWLAPRREPPRAAGTLFAGTLA